MKPELRLCPNCGAPVSAEHTLMTCEFCKAPLMMARAPVAPVAPAEPSATNRGVILAIAILVVVIGGVVPVVLLMSRPQAPPPPPMPVIPEMPAPGTPPANQGGVTGAGVVAMFDTQCAQGDGQSCLAAGALYEHGQMGLPKDKAKARSYYDRGCKLGNAGACSMR